MGRFTNLINILPAEILGEALDKIEDDNTAADRDAQNEPETRKMLNGRPIAGLELQKDDLKNMDSRTKYFAKKTMIKLMKEREQTRALVVMHEAKIAEMDNDFEQQVVRARIAQGSEIALREHYSKAKKGYQELSQNEKESRKIAKDQQARINYLESQKTLQ